MKLGSQWMREWGGNEPTHIYPVGDLREHDTRGSECWCEPTVEYLGSGSIVTHNSADQREKYETGQRKPS